MRAIATEMKEKAVIQVPEGALAVLAEAIEVDLTGDAAMEAAETAVAEVVECDLSAEEVIEDHEIFMTMKIGSTAMLTSPPLAPPRPQPRPTHPPLLPPLLGPRCRPTPTATKATVPNLVESIIGIALLRQIIVRKRPIIPQFRPRKRKRPLTATSQTRRPHPQVLPQQRPTLNPQPQQLSSKSD